MTLQLQVPAVPDRRRQSEINPHQDREVEPAPVSQRCSSRPTYGARILEIDNQHRPENMGRCTYVVVADSQSYVCRTLSVHVQLV